MIGQNLHETPQDRAFISYGIQAQRERQVQRERKRSDSLAAPVEAPSSERMSELSGYYNKALESIQLLRHPIEFPDLGDSSNDAMVDDSYGTSQNTAGISNSNMPYATELARRIGSSVGADGRQRPLTGEQMNILASSLSRFDKSTLANLEESGLKIRIYDSDNPPPGGYPGGRQQWKPGSLGYYVGNKKLLILRQKDFENGGSRGIRDVIHHETGHAIDDMLHPDTGADRVMATEKDPYLEGLYDSYKRRANASSSAAWSDYAKTNAQEYFAEGVEWYTGGESNRQELRQKDPQLYAYVEQKLNQSTDRALPSRQRGGQIAGNRYPVRNEPPPVIRGNNNPNFPGLLGFPPTPYAGLSPSPFAGFSPSALLQGDPSIQYLMMIMMRQQMMMLLMLSMYMSGNPGNPSYYT